MPHPDTPVQKTPDKNGWKDQLAYNRSFRANPRLRSWDSRCTGNYFLVLLVSPPQPVTLVVTMVAKPKAKTRATITFFMCKLL